jgi:hypothetical protein
MFKILKNDLVTGLHKSVVRSAKDANHQNKSESLNPDESHHKYESMKTNNFVANRTRPKAHYTD